MATCLAGVKELFAGILAHGSDTFTQESFYKLSRERTNTKLRARFFKSAQELAQLSSH